MSSSCDDKEDDLLYDIEDGDINELDYEEDEKRDEEKDFDKFKHRISTSSLAEDGEVISSGDEDLQETTPPYQHSPRRVSDKKVYLKTGQSDSPPTSLTESNNNICRHFLQGRCSWGEECRFLHKLPDNYGVNNEGSFPKRFPSSHRLVPLVIEGQLLTDGRYPMIRPRDPLNYYNHMTWVVHERGVVRGGVAPPPRSREKEEESEGWHRLRTITDWNDSEDEEERSSVINSNKRRKENKYAPPSSDSDNSDNGRGKKKRKSSSPYHHRGEEDKPRSKSIKKKKKKDTTSDAISNNKLSSRKKSLKNMSTSRERQEKITKEIEEVDKEIKKQNKSLR